MSTGHLIYYFGNDEAFYKVLQGEFKATYPSLNATFKQFFEAGATKIQSLYLMAYEHQPSLVFIDYSKNSKDYLHLARLFTRTINYHKFKLIGLLDYLSPPEVIQESILTGVKINHIKSAEVLDVVYSAVKLISPKDAKEHGFATAKASDAIDVGILCKIGYINHEMIHFETDLKLNQNEEITIQNHWSEQKIIKSSNFFVHEIKTSNLYYNFNYGVDAAITFVNPPALSPEMSDERKKELTNEYEHDTTKFQRKLKAWIIDNLGNSLRKNVKVLIIDKELTMYKSRRPTDQYDYLIRCQPFLKDVNVEINRQRAQVIAYSLEIRPDDAAPDAVYNDAKGLKTIVEVIKNKYDDSYRPYLIVFNCGDSSSKELQESYGYDNLLAYSGEISSDILLKMAEVFSKKVEAMKESSKELAQTIYLKKISPMTFGEILAQITVQNYSETDLVFQSARPLDLYSVLHFKFPVDMYVTIIPNDKYKGDMYYGLIHGVGEIGKKNLRHHVNTIFFRDLENQKQSERDEFEKLNQAKLKEIQDEQAKKQAELEAAAQEENLEPESQSEPEKE